MCICWIIKCLFVIDARCKLEEFCCCLVFFFGYNISFDTYVIGVSNFVRQGRNLKKDIFLTGDEIFASSIVTKYLLKK